MTRHRQDRARRTPVLILCLALFMVSSNYCLLSAWGGNSSMACLALPKQAVNATRGCHHCAVPSAPSSHGKPASGRSCCPAPVVTPSATSLDKHEAISVPLMASLAAAPQALPAPPAGAWHGRRALSDGRPPTRYARAPLPARAPPLA
jgi:hypothetical protein